MFKESTCRQNLLLVLAGSQLCSLIAYGLIRRQIRKSWRMLRASHYFFKVFIEYEYGDGVQGIHRI